MKLLNKNKQILKMILCVVIFITQIYFIILNIKKPSGPLSYTWHPAIWITVALLTFLVFGMHLFPVYKNMFKKIFDMNTLLGIAAHTLFIYSFVNSMIHIKEPMYSYDVFWEDTILLVIFSYIGNELSARLKSSSIDGYKQLLKLKSKTAIIIRNQKEEDIPINEVKIGDILVVKKGMNIPIDGKLLSETATIDKSLITGESKDEILAKNDDILSGTTNIGNKITMEVTKLIDDSFVYVLIDKADDLSLSKPKIQILVTKVLRYFIPTVLILSITTFIIWIILGYGFDIQFSWFKGANQLDNAILAAVTVLAIACPCAFGVATPLIVTISASSANKNSLLFNDPDSFEKIKDVKVVAFDKTGTLTTGEMKIVNNTLSDSEQKCVSAIESYSIHPIAKIIYNSNPSQMKVENVEEVIGKGIKGEINGSKYTILKSNTKPTFEGATHIEVKKDGELIGFIEVMDEIKRNALETIEFLRKMKIKTIMITGDSEAATLRVNKHLKLDNVYYNQTPDDKFELIKNLKKDMDLKEKEQILYIGDGVNDLLAIKEADISMAFSSGSDVANSFSDISILNDNIFSIVNAFKLSQQTQKHITLSLAWALIFNIVALPIAFVMLIQPWVAAILMLCSDVAVILNAIYFKWKMKKYFKKNSKN
ncbi:hypothetical protein C4B24_02865 [Mycoplasma marinum]|uniref:P-type ATPase A domain-containing protein n=2 Tax=Mycoplasma marinum TaxID=1937190 RepID=A0A4R0XKE6_9MOLU|nr:hypothetical protein C4B24_02865 [Mycoplasma marinum]